MPGRLRVFVRIERFLRLVQMAPTARLCRMSFIFIGLGHHVGIAAQMVGRICSGPPPQFPCFRPSALGSLVKRNATRKLHKDRPRALGGEPPPSARDSRNPRHRSAHRPAPWRGAGSRASSARCPRGST
eukprot:scaffold41251_cov51-Phaeocystis_antarctica.AAC.3